jgi:hypothetical protein
MKERIKKLFYRVTDRLPRHYKIELRLFGSPSEIIKAYAEDINSDFKTTFEWYLNHLANKEKVEDGELYISPSTPNEIKCITTSDYIMVASKLLKEMGNKEIIYLFLRELGTAYYFKKKTEEHPAIDGKVKKFARRWYSTLKKEGLLNGNSTE